MAHELFLEIGTEEIPAGFIAPTTQALEQTLAERLKELHLAHGAMRTAATPRRLAITIADLPERQPDIEEEILGPPKAAGFDATNNPTKAAIGFAKSRGAGVEDLTVVTTPKGEYLMLRLARKGQQTRELLQTLLPEVIAAMSFPKSMRWAEGELAFARPIHWFVALYDGKVVPFSLNGIASGASTFGHRFMAPTSATVNGFDSYLARLREVQVLADPSERRAVVVEEIHRAAAGVKGKILPDEALVDTVTNLVEKPHAVCGTFEKRFLELPREVLITSMREHQKYFSVVDKTGALMPHFVAVNNTDIADRALAAAGHQRVLRARLEDAFFFYKEDQKRTLASRVEDLGGVIFQAKLGTMLDKTRRISKLATFLAERLAPEMKQTASRAATLAKADLLTAMVNEFPSLQGIIGRAYATLNGEAAEVGAAIEEHYMPVRAGEALPASTTGRLVSLADRLDTIAGCFGIGQVPTGTADPFGLRRLALGLLHIIADAPFSLSLREALGQAIQLYGDKLSEPADQATQAALDFIKGRFSNDLIGQGLPAETVEAVTSVAFDDPTDCRMRIMALHEISAQPAFTILAGSFKRVMNIIKEHAGDRVDAKLLTEEAEQQLHTRFLAVRQEALPLLDQKKYREAMAVILQMKEPVDLFFDKVLVMADDAAVRRNRLSLLAAIAGLFLRIGDFSKMYALNH